MIPSSIFDGHTTGDIPSVRPTAEEVAPIFVRNIAVVTLIPYREIVLLTPDVGKVYPEDKGDFIFDNTFTQRNSDRPTLFDFKGTIDLTFCPFPSRNRAFTPVFRDVFSNIAFTFVH